MNNKRMKAKDSSNSLPRMKIMSRGNHLKRKSKMKKVAMSIIMRRSSSQKNSHSRINMLIKNENFVT